MKRNGWVNTLPVDWSGNELNIGMNEIFAGKKRNKPNKTAKKKNEKKKRRKKNHKILNNNCSYKMKMIHIIILSKIAQLASSQGYGIDWWRIRGKQTNKQKTKTTNRQNKNDNINKE